MGVGRAVNDNQILVFVSEHLTQLAGQKATITKAKKAVAQFRSRDGMKIGTRVTSAWSAYVGLHGPFGSSWLSTH